MKNEIKIKIIEKLLEEYESTRSIHAACSACELLIEEIKAGRLVL